MPLYVMILIVVKEAWSLYYKIIIAIKEMKSQFTMFDIIFCFSYVFLFMQTISLMLDQVDGCELEL